MSRSLPPSGANCLYVAFAPLARLDFCKAPVCSPSMKLQLTPLRRAFQDNGKLAAVAELRRHSPLVASRNKMRSFAITGSISRR